MRDFDTHPYSAEELRVATWFSDKGAGGGDDPIGAMIASHESLAAQRKLAWAAMRAVAQHNDRHGSSLPNVHIDMIREALGE